MKDALSIPPLTDSMTMAPRSKSCLTSRSIRAHWPRPRSVETATATVFVAQLHRHHDHCWHREMPPQRQGQNKMASSSEPHFDAPLTACQPTLTDCGDPSSIKFTRAPESSQAPRRSSFPESRKLCKQTIQERVASVSRRCEGAQEENRTGRVITNQEQEGVVGDELCIDIF
jgi:hypothetical protein